MPQDILFCCRTFGGMHTGGRFLAWIMAEALASRGHRVVFWGDVLPDFARDFADYPDHARIEFLGADERLAPDRPFQLIVVVPHLGLPRSFFPRALGWAANCGARVVLLNFETPNWFEALVPGHRNPVEWDTWRLVAQESDVVLSLAREGTRYAREFYGQPNSYIRYANVHPGINSRVADLAVGERKRQVICITRLSAVDAHKGGDDLWFIFGPHLCNHELVLIVGQGDGGCSRARQTGIEMRRERSPLADFASH